MRIAVASMLLALSLPLVSLAQPGPREASRGGLAPAKDVQDAIDALPPTGGTVRLKAGQYWQRRPLNLRGREGVRLVGAGVGTKLVFALPPQHADHPLIDMVGAQRCEISHLEIATRKGTVPSAALLLGRVTQDGPGAAQHRFDSLRIACNCSIANVVSLGSEVNTYTHCHFLNSQPGGANYVTGRQNWVGAKSPFGAVHGGSNLCHYFYNVSFGVYARTGQETNIILQSGTKYFCIFGGFMSNKSLDRTKPDQGGLTGIRIGGPTPLPCEQIRITGLEAETHGTKNAVQIVGLVRGLRLENNLFQSLESAIRVTGTLYDSVIEQNSLEAGMARYEWRDGPKRALMTVSGATVCTSRIDLRWRWLGLLSRDQSPRDQGRRPEIALSVMADGPGCEFSENEIILRSRSDMLITPTVEAHNNEVRALR